MEPQFLGALTRWLLKGCKTNLWKEWEDDNPWNNKKDNENFVIGMIVAMLILGLGMLLVKYKLFPFNN